MDNPEDLKGRIDRSGYAGSVFGESFPVDESKEDSVLNGYGSVNSMLNGDGSVTSLMENGSIGDRGVDCFADDSIGTGGDSSECDSSGDNELNPENFHFKDFDVSLDDLNACLAVSRIVHDSVVRGKVDALVEEANEKIASRDMLILSLEERLRPSEIGSTSMEPEGEGMGQSCLLDSRAEHIYVECLQHLKVATVDQLQALEKSVEHLMYSALMEVNSYVATVDQLQGQVLDGLKFNKMNELSQVFLKDVFERIKATSCLLEDLLSEHKWMCYLEREFVAIVVKASITRLQDEFDRKLENERKLIGFKFSMMFDEVRLLREELDFMSMSSVSCESRHFGAQCGPESSEEASTIRAKDTFLPPPHVSEVKVEVVDSPLLHMTKEDLINYFKTEMAKMKRDHESALQKKTEELFVVKRELLKEKGSLSSKKDRDYEVLRRRVPEIITKLDSILKFNEKCEDEYEKLSSDGGYICNLIWDNPCPTGSLVEKSEMSDCLSQKDSEKMPPSFPKEDLYLQQIDRLRQDVEDVKIEAELRENVCNVFSQCWIAEANSHLEFLGMEVKNIRDIYSTMLAGTLEESRTHVDSMNKRYHELKGLLESDLEKEWILHSEVEIPTQSRHELQLLQRSIEEKDEYVKGVLSELLQLKEQFEEVSLELSLLRDGRRIQEKLLLDRTNELLSVKHELSKALDLVCQYKVKTTTLDEDLRVALNGLNEAAEEKTLLHKSIQEMQNQILMAISVERTQREKTKSFFFSIIRMSKSIDAFERSMLNKIERNNARLDSLKNQMGEVMQLANSLQGEVSCCKQSLEIRSCNLQKAEAEVNQLGDEVDALLNLLAQVYRSLERYSPVLQHYPGVTEALELIRGEVNRV